METINADRIDDLLAEYAEKKDYVENRKPYWLFLDAQGELEWGLFNYFPEAHYKQAIDQAFQAEAESDLLPDGGKRTQYYWSSGDGVVYHTEVGDEMVDPFFGSVEEAERYLEDLADTYGMEEYDGLVLRKSGNRKVMEATEVLTEQSGLTDW